MIFRTEPMPGYILHGQVREAKADRMKKFRATT